MTRLSLSLLGFAALVLALAPARAAARPGTPAASPETSPEVRQIRSKLRQWERTRDDQEGTELPSASQPGAEGSRARVFRKGGRVMIVDESYYAETGQATWSFYYDSSKPFFVLVTETRYAYPITVTAEERRKLGGGEDKTIENRYYFKGGRLIRWLEGKKPVPARGERFRDQARSVLELAESALKNASRDR